MQVDIPLALMIFRGALKTTDLRSGKFGRTFKKRTTEQFDRITKPENYYFTISEMNKEP